MDKKILFIIPRLPDDEVSFTSVCKGLKGVSGTIGTILQVMDGLFNRGYDVEAWIVSKQCLIDTNIYQYTDEKMAIEAGQSSIVVQCMWDNDEILAKLNHGGITPWLWTHVPLTHQVLDHLNNRRLDTVIVVSDTTRLPSIHTRRHYAVERIYNPLNKLWLDEDSFLPRYNSKQIVSAGFLGESKGVHRILQTWPLIKRKVADATLFIIGGLHLYRQNIEFGNLGISTPDFEKKYLLPIIDEFGSFDDAGIKFPGILSPSEIRDLYLRSTLGFVNFNTREFTETFCCTAIEMLATGLPILSVAAGALPETVGRSGGACLVLNYDPQIMAKKAIDLLNDSKQLELMGQKGKDFVKKEYELNNIIDDWEYLMSSPLQNKRKLNKTWNGPQNWRYYIGTALGQIGAGDWLHLLLKKVFSRNHHKKAA